MATCALLQGQALSLRASQRTRQPCRKAILVPSPARTLLRRGVAPEPVDAPRQCRTQVFPFDQAWAPSAEKLSSLAPQLFAISLFPYLAFLYFLSKPETKAPRLALFGFYFLLVFVGATIPAGIYAKTHYGQALANVDWLHGGAESLLTVTNLLVVLGMRQAIRQAEEENEARRAREQEQAGAAAQQAGPEQAEKAAR